MIAEVIIDSSVKTLNRIFDYEIPADLDIKVGSRVFVPFGRKKELEEAIVVGIKEESEYKVKEIASLQQEQIKDEYIELAKWMGDRYFCNVADCLKLMLPPGRTTKSVEKRVKDKMVNMISLKEPVEKIQYDIDNGIIKAQRQIDVLEFLLSISALTTLLVKVPAHSQGSFEKTIAISVRPSYFIPAAQSAAIKPCAAVTPPFIISMVFPSL